MKLNRYLCILLAGFLFCGCSDDGDDDSPECGNGKVESGEACDDGNDVDDDACRNDCTKNEQVDSPECGNGKVESGEACDDGNEVDDDACRNDCTKNEQVDEPECGNGKVESGEACDDGNDVDDDACHNDCTKNEVDAPKCGNGKLEDGEACDDGNEVDDDACHNDCTKNEVDAPKCGNGKLEDGEACDDGNEVDDDECRNDCTKNEATWYSPNPGAETKCGDRRLEAGEICEIGQINEAHPDWTCVKQDERCVWQTPGVVCGNGIVEDGEACDDGNSIAGDGCSKKCQKEDAGVCQMRNGSKAEVLLVQDGDTLKLRLFNDGKCTSKTIVTTRIHGLDCPECLKSKTVSPIDESYNAAQACDVAKKAPCSDTNLYDYATLAECQNHNERGGYEAAEYVNSLIYSEENGGIVDVGCETVSDTDSTCLLDNTRSRYLAYIGVKSGGATVDLGEMIIQSGWGIPFTAFSSQKTEAYCRAESEAVSSHAGVWANGSNMTEAAEASFGTDKLSWLLDESHCE